MAANIGSSGFRLSLCRTVASTFSFQSPNLSPNGADAAANDSSDLFGRLALAGHLKNHLKDRVIQMGKTATFDGGLLGNSLPYGLWMRVVVGSAHGALRDAELFRDPFDGFPLGVSKLSNSGSNVFVPCGLGIPTAR